MGDTASNPDSERAHDLIDLQIAVAGGSVDLARAREVCIRLFDYRREQARPPVISKGAGQDELYASQAKAVKWANALVTKIDASE